MISEESDMRSGLVAGYNVDHINVAAGMRELSACGYGDSGETKMVIEHALMRWARGEEEQAQRGALLLPFWILAMLLMVPFLMARFLNLAVVVAWATSEDWADNILELLR